ncbi:aldo/keto reductase [Streptomyces sp. 3MP-14]|uniref:Aldo/keto reductase n=1 Tax=Streptomyces mimosae TaxID=2586635 RepID=A0A5N6A0L2_9ACTN|nr:MULTISPECIES: aldo/keto reductase [Streptomyces]KAB8162281.1 aldo/keto reductase [Streptomyces mimosae]KAB8173820.1 aldo/keto reductase [Streptomyces sp. 3MP-14]
MSTRLLGSTGLAVGPIGLGCMGMSWGYAESQRDDAASVEVIHRALDAGPILLDTADAYGEGHNETLVGRALAGRRSEAVLATKVGIVVEDLATRRLGRDGSPAHIRAGVDASLRRLGVDVIDLYYLHRVDPTVPLAESWGALAELVTEGKVRHLGLSEVTVEQAEEAHRAHPVAAVQSELSLWTREPLDPTTGLVGWCARAGAAFVPFAPLGRGFLTGRYSGPGDFERGDFRATNPRFQDAAFAANLRIVEVVETVAARHGATAAQVALAWTLTRGEHVIPIPGTRQLGYLAANLAAAELRLDARDLAELDAAPAATGSRY